MTIPKKAKGKPFRKKEKIQVSFSPDSKKSVLMKKDTKNAKYWQKNTKNVGDDDIELD